MTRLIVAGFAVAMTVLNRFIGGSWSLAIWMTAAQFALFLILGLGLLAVEHYKHDLEVRRAAEDAARFLAGEWRKH